MKKWFMLCALVFCFGVANAQHAEYPNVPLDDPAYADFNTLYAADVLEPYVSGFWRQGITDYEFAVAVAGLTSQIENDNKLKLQFKIAGSNPSGLQCPIGTESTDPREALTKNPQALQALIRLNSRFAKLIEALGIPADKGLHHNLLNGYLDAPLRPVAPKPKPQIAPPFSDVPKNHWAFSAVEKLRQDGVLLGYPGDMSIETGK